jgi:hypothetical protein
MFPKSTKPAIVLLSAIAALASPALFAAEPKATGPELEFFEKKIRPVLVASCYKCHSAESEKIKGGLLLDTREGLIKGGDSGPAVVPGFPNKSLLIQSMRHDDPDLAMPPKGDKLSDDVIANFEKWVKIGAPDPRVAKPGAVAKVFDMEKAREHWSFKPVSKQTPPAVNDPARFIQNPIDNFVLAKLQEQGLHHSKKADKRALLRRVTYDLIGLPPSPEEMDEFLADESPNAFEKVVDRLLASPRYGERWGRHWLDIARYADTSGDRQNGARAVPLYPFAWTYRDYVIQAFNEDLPYDQFILQQIAADKLPEGRKSGDAKEVLPALGFLTVGKRFMGNNNEMIDDQIDVVTKGLMGVTAACARCHDHKFDPIPTKDYYSLHGIFNSSREPAIENKPLLDDPEQDPQYKDFLKQVANVEAEVVDYEKSEAVRMLGGMIDKAGEYLLVAHESLNTNDPKKKGNNFRLTARNRGLESELAQIWLETVRTIKSKPGPVFTPWFRFAEIPEKQFAEKAPEIAADIAAASESEVHPLLAKAFEEKQPNSLADVAAIYTEVLGKLRGEMQLKPYTYRRGGRASVETKMVSLANPELESLRVELFGDASLVKPSVEAMRRALGNQFSNPIGAIRAKIVQLNMFHPGAPARAMVLEDVPRPKDSPVLIRGEAGNRGPVVPRQFPEILSPEGRKPFTDGSGRLELAKAIASPSNPLTARVMANRIWQWHFGQAIVRTVSDFGTRSEPPTHPELLDYLANWFVENGWSMKKLHKHILLSGTYQQDSRPNAKGMKVDPTNQWLWRMNLQRLDLEQIRDSLLVFGGKLDLTMGGPPIMLVNDDRPGRYRAMSGDFKTPPEKQNRRTVYGMIDRSGLPDVFNTFDFANPDMSTGERILTTVPQQALFLMNSPFIVSQVKNLLARPDFPSDGTVEEKVTFLYRTVFQRTPSDGEIKMAAQFVSAEPEADSAPTARTVALPADEAKPGMRKKGMRTAGGAKQEPSTILNAWERYTQVMMLANEVIYLN